MSVIQQLLTDHIDIWTAADTEKKSGRGRASGNASSVYGIKKLRELILELAVHGKLVPQDANDEPASELLKRIQAEKAKLIAKNELKKDKPLAPIGDDKKPFELPHGWEWCRFGDIVKICTGKLDANAADENGSYPFFTCSQTPSSINNYSFDTSAVLLAGNGDFNVKYYQGKFDAYQRTYVIEPIIFGLKFCFLLVLAQIEIITKNNRGSAIPYLKIGDLTNPIFALPPLAAQNRIVAKVDELMALCDQLETQHSNAAEAHEKLVSHLLGTLTQSQDSKDFSNNWQRIAAHFDTLFTTEVSIDALKQTLLQMAVMGKLVPQDANDEPASELLKRIQAEKVRLIAEGKVKKDKPLTPITDEEKPFELPQGWEWVKCQDVCLKITDGEHATPTRTESGFYLLSARNVTNEGIILDDVDYVPLDEFERIRSRCDPNIGDILISCSGSVGRVALVDKDNAYSMVRSAAMIRPNNNWLCNEYLALLLRSVYLQDQMKSRSKQSAQANLFLGAISNLVLIIPPFEEQHRIVAKVDELMTLCDQLKSRIQQANQLQQKLADVLVEQAVTC